MKTVNDVYGHAAGDIAIRSVVRAIREVIRAEDLIFRWGGDEFFVIMIGIDSETALSRMDRLEELLSSVQIDTAISPLKIKVSHAFEDFADLSEIDATIKRADAGMYRQKQIRKGMMSPNHAAALTMMSEREVLIGR